MTVATGFAPDPGVPDRDVLLDPVALAPSLDAVLGLGGPAGITKLEQLHVRYRVGRGVGLVLRVHTGHDSLIVSARSFERGRAASNYERALENAPRAVQGMCSVALAPKLETVFWTFPCDRRITSLELLRGASGSLASLVSRPCSPVLAAYVPEKAATARCVDGRGAPLAYVKVYAPAEHDGGLASFKLLGWLHGALDVAGGHLRTPRALAYDARDCAVAFEAIDGRPLVLQSDATGTAHLAGLGAALGALHSTVPPPGLRQFERLAPHRVVRAAELLGAVRPDVDAAARELAGHLVSTLEEHEAPVWLHGDVHPKNALWNGRTTALVDLDQAALGPPAADLGSMLAGLRYLRCLGLVSGAREEALASALLDGYRSVRELPDRRALCWHTAASLLCERALRSVTRVRPAGLARLGEVIECGLRALPPRARTVGSRSPVGQSRRPRLLMYCQHAVGLGHLTRSLALAAGLAERFDVVVLSGGAVPRHTAPATGVGLVALPPLMLREGGGLLSGDPARTVQQAQAVRARMLADAVRGRPPAVVLVELFPFGRKAFAAEILGMLDEARTQPDAPPLVVSSVRDILVGRGSEQRAHDERASQLANAHLDAILVHSDPRFARLQESFDPDTPLRVPVHHTGFVTAPPRDAPRRRDGGSTVVVSAGGGRVGEPLLQAAIDAFPRLREHGMRMRVIAGPFLPDDAWHRLRARSDEPDLVVLREVEDLSAELARAAVSVSQCGYNTALEVVKSGIPALAVPYLAPGEDEQIRRAQRLSDLGAVRMLDPRELSGSRLAAAIEELPSGSPQHVDLDLDGATMSTELVWRMHRRRVGRIQAVVA
ncbi:MAG TPA: phosphotransferase [Solirubrobacteraceae bacterium]|nr:phosphotransferase [Solirubrobacteraceae bacterium]